MTRIAPHIAGWPVGSPFAFVSPVSVFCRVHTAVLHAALGGGGARAVLGAIADMRADKFVPNVSLYNKARKRQQYVCDTTYLNNLLVWAGLEFLVSGRVSPILRYV